MKIEGGYEIAIENLQAQVTVIFEMTVTWISSYPLFGDGPKYLLGRDNYRRGVLTLLA